MSELEKFTEASERKAFDLSHRQLINLGTGRYEKALRQGLSQFSNLDLARSRAAYTKWKVLENLDKYLLEFESNFNKRGGKVIWATNAESALKQIMEVFSRAGVKKVVKSKSMVSEEIGLNDFLHKKGIELVETDLGEYIVQLSGEKPYHMVTPAMHKSREEISDLFHEKIGTPENSSVEDLVEGARKLLRNKYLSADASITGANFLIADSGSVAITENEGNARLSFSFPKIQIVVTGIEKVLPSLNDLDYFWPLLSTFGTGQNLTTYNSILSGPKNSDEHDGPEEMYVVLIDNGRTEVLGQNEQRQALGCIRCGACLNVCPVFKNIGGHSYGTTYQGPVGSVITPFMSDFKEYKHLSFASTICGRCTQVCPVKIDLHTLLLDNRRDSVAKNHVSKFESYIWGFWKGTMLSRKKMNRGATAKNFLLKTFFKNAWGKRREMPKIASKSFNEIWLEKNKAAK